MSVSAAAILSVLLAKTPWVDRDVPAEQRAAELQPIGAEIADVARSPEEAAMLIVLGRAEGENFALAIVRGGCTASGCDRGRSRGVFQEREVACPAPYRFAAGTLESMRLEVRCAISLLRAHAGRCRRHALTPWHGAFAGYATGSRCRWSGADDRVKAMRKIERELARVEAAQ